jgi:hypothetical protein
MGLQSVDSAVALNKLADAEDNGHGDSKREAKGMP